MREGWIKLHRRLTGWEWYSDIPTKVALLHLILVCNHAKTRWRGIELDVGETVKSLDTLARESGISVMQWRTAINNLKSTQSITERKYGKFRILKLNKYNQYQTSNTISNNEVTDKQQGDNREVTADKKEKNDKKEKKTMSAVADASPQDMELARMMAKGLRKTNPAFAQKYPTDKALEPKVKRWAADFEKTRRLDHATEEQIRFVIRWLYESDSRDAEFWRVNVQSGAKLREKYQTLVAVIKRENEAKKKSDYVFIS